MTQDLDTVRRDLFAVKADERDGAGWCFMHICRSKATADRRAKDIRDNHSLGLNRLAKVVHPKQWVVNGFTAAGNTIED